MAARVAAGPAPLRETMAAQLILSSRWDARTEPLVDPMAGGATIPIEAAGLAVGAAIRRPSDLPQRQLAAFKDLPHEAPDLFPGTVPKIVALDADPDAFPRWWATSCRGVDRSRARGLNRHRATGRSRATPDYIERMLPAARHMKPGVFTITVVFLGGLTTSQRNAFKGAADRWSTVIVGDLRTSSSAGR